ncbi:Acg family FMN-binding oxidoreductase [Halobacterium wangiae]|uniref:Acg family FMN-binding oxidoreductase n=1 Tax=Halobacterium wangiae TaxID=2902623 RepID=UPI001E5D2010|nr:nitroreductase family protein [Halobacterium wangiae]
MGPEDLTTDVWRVDPNEFPADATVAEQARFLLRYAVLAPSSHNSQPWRLDVDGDAVTVEPDESRWLRVADQSHRELYVSLGCAVENLVVAADAFGFDPRVAYETDRDALTATVHLGDRDSGPVDRTPTFAALTERSTSHAPFDDRPLDDATLDRLRDAAGDYAGSLHVVAADDKRAVGELQAEADRALMDDPEYRRELGHWVGTGALGASWLAARVGQLAVTHLDLGGREARKNSKLIGSAPAVLVLATPDDDHSAHVDTGRAFERIALAATAAGVAVHPMSQTLERESTRERLADALGIADEHPQHLFRVGYADEATDHTPRWPVEAVLADDD